MTDPDLVLLSVNDCITAAVELNRTSTCEDDCDKVRVEVDDDTMKVCWITAVDCWLSVVVGIFCDKAVLSSIAITELVTTASVSIRYNMQQYII